MDFLRSNLWEIRNSFSLRYLGIVLSICHLTTFALWRETSLFTGGNPVCWSFFPTCAENWLLSQNHISLLLNLYAGLSLISLLVFLSYRLLGLGHFSLGLSFFINLVLYLHDFNLANNFNVLLLFLTFSFVFVPQKVRLAKTIYIGSHLIWGLSKLNEDWLAGYWLSEHLANVVPIKGIEWIAAISLFAEIVVPFFLLSRHRQRIFTGVLLLFTYNLIYGYILGVLPTVSSILLLIFFVVSYFEDERIQRESIYRSYIRPEPSRLWVWIPFVIFFIFQLLPYGLEKKGVHLQIPLTYLTHPVPVECFQETLVVYNNKTLHYSSDFVTPRSELLKCQEYIYKNEAKELCGKYSQEPQFVKISSYFTKRNISDKNFKRVFEIDNICGESHRVSREEN